MSDECVRLQGWGRTMPSAARLRQATIDGLGATLPTSNPRGVLARGLGRSYNDAAQNGGGEIIKLVEGEIRPPTSQGILEIEAGVTLDALLRFLVPQGWFVPVTPGTRFVTIGGALACDVHGKNHHVHGGFADHVYQFEMVLADGSRQLFDRSSPVFFATVGGMGLTGIITRVWMQLIRIESAFMAVQTSLSSSLDETFSLLDEHDALPYSVAWIDAMAKGSGLGRGVISHGRHAKQAEVADRSRSVYAPRQLLNVPDVVQRNLLANSAVRLFNRAWYQRAAVRARHTFESIAAFFHPLDAVGNWNRLYGRPGFVQHQMVVPTENRAAIRDALHAVSSGGHSSFLTVLKRLGPSSGGLLSFPMPGWTLAVDLPNRGTATARLLDRLDAIAGDAGGRVYLAKDSNLTPDRLEGMYAEISNWKKIRDDLDSERMFQSDLARRLHL